MIKLRKIRFSQKALDLVEMEANRYPMDANRQAMFYQKVLESNMDPKPILQRFEKIKYAKNEECLKHYVEALAKAGKSKQIFEKVKEYFSKERGDKNLPMHVVVHDKYSFGRALFSLIKTAAWAFFLLTGASMMMESQGYRLPNQQELNQETKPDVKFDDVAGIDEAKQELQEIVEFLKNPQKFTKLGGRMPKGVLLTGPPGTGKTLLARAVAGEANVPFFFMSGSEFDELYVGVGARRVRDLFQAARAKAPSIIFIDEIDVIGSKRNPKDQSFSRQTLNQLLVDLDGFQNEDNVVFIGATNFPELLDKALTRPGRFDKVIEVGLPDVRGRLQILMVHLRKMALDKNVDHKILARTTPGFSGADLNNLVNQAAIMASLENKKFVSMLHFEKAKDKIIMGAERKSAIMTEESRRITAYHEGGHALVAMFTEHAIPLHKATIIPRGQSLGMTVQIPEMDKVNYTKLEYQAMLDVCMGGRVAEHMILGENITSGAHNDFQQATQIALRMISQLGMNDKFGPLCFDLETMSPLLRHQIEMETKLMLDCSQKRVKLLLEKHLKQLHLLASALLEHETLSKHEIQKIIT